MRPVILVPADSATYISTEGSPWLPEKLDPQQPKIKLPGPRFSGTFTAAVDSSSVCLQLLPLTPQLLLPG